MTSFLQPIPIFGDFRTKYIGQQENIFLVSFSKWHFEYYTASANLFHSIQKKADISTADISKIWQLTWKRFRLKNNTKLDLGVNHVFKLVDLTSTVLIHNCCQLHLKNKRQVGELIRGQCHIFHCSLACASPYQSSFTEFRKVVFFDANRPADKQAALKTYFSLSSLLADRVHHLNTMTAATVNQKQGCRV